MCSEKRHSLSKISLPNLVISDIKENGYIRLKFQGDSGMKKWIFALMIIFVIILISFCSRDENKFTVQEKLKNDTYRVIAYKEKIDEKNVQIIKETMKEGNWKKSVIKLKKNPSDYIFYFNYDKEEGGIPVYHLWLTVNPLEVKVYSERMEMQLEGEEAKRLIETILDVEFNRE